MGTRNDRAAGTEQPEFRMRMYSKVELAMLYFPNASPEVARHALLRWIKRCPQIVEGLKRLEHRKHCKFFTRKEVEVIVEALGEP